MCVCVCRAGEYPQFFIAGEGGAAAGGDALPRFVGLWDTIEMLNEVTRAF